MDSFDDNSFTLGICRSNLLHTKRINCQLRLVQNRFSNVTIYRCSYISNKFVLSTAAIAWSTQKLTALFLWSIPILIRKRRSRSRVCSRVGKTRTFWYKIKIDFVRNNGFEWQRVSPEMWFKFMIFRIPSTVSFVRTKCLRVRLARNGTIIPPQRFEILGRAKGNLLVYVRLKNYVSRCTERKTKIAFDSQFTVHTVTNEIER